MLNLNIFFCNQVPMSDIWENIGVGMKIETYNFDCDLPNSVYWIATVMKIAGEFSPYYYLYIAPNNVHIQINILFLQEIYII